MGVVYRARDTRLDRDAAIKALPEEVAENSARLARFEREAKLLASLKNPHIATIYGLEQAEGQRFLAMELVEGVTLAERLSKGPIPVREALELARQIAEALEVAHVADVIHRDVKPGNIMIGKDGKAKVLDFGLAKALRAGVQETDSLSPTLTQSMTQAGQILGTPVYMSPEQTRGEEAGKQTDIWSFGCVLFEMLSGKRAFPGGFADDAEKEPDWGALPEEMPPLARSVLRRCLERDPRRRLHNIADGRLEIEESIREPALGEVWSLPTKSATLATREGALRALTAIAIVAVLALTGWIVTRPQPSTPDVRRFDLQPPRGVKLQLGGGAHRIAISSDGRLVAFRGVPVDGSSPAQLYLRSVEELGARPLPGTRNGLSPFFSPDARWLGFWVAGELRKIPLAGGEPVSLCQVAGIRGASWGEDNTIVFSTPNGGISRVSADGGEPAAITVPDPMRGEVDHRWPEFLPGGRAILFVVTSGGRESRNRIAVVSLQTGEQRMLWTGGTKPSYARSGHLLYSRLGTVYAVEFDPTRLEIVGAPRPVLDDVRFPTAGGDVRFAVAEEGSMVYVPGAWRPPESELVSVDRQGNVERLLESRQAYESPRFSPDGRRVAVTVHRSVEDADIWVYELERGTRTRLSSEGAYHPVWSPDGDAIIFTSDRNGPWELFRAQADGTGPVELIATSQGMNFPGSFTPSGSVVLFQGGSLNWDIFSLDATGDGTPQAVLATPALEVQPVLSPDGRWLAYTSDESGQLEVNVRPFPGPGGAIQASLTGGTDPIWHPTGRELFYRETPRLNEPSRRILSVPMSTEADFSIGRPRLVVETDFDSTSQIAWHSYDIFPDGERFVMVRPPEESGLAPRLVFAPNWIDEIEQLFASSPEQ